MPTYVYRFTDTGETIEIQQSFSDPTLDEYAHPSDGVPRPVKKVFQPVGVTFKGNGFYKTDSRSGSSSSSSASSGSGSGASSGSTNGSSSESTASSSSSPGTGTTSPTTPASTSGGSSGSGASTTP